MSLLRTLFEKEQRAAEQDDDLISLRAGSEKLENVHPTFPEVGSRRSLSFFSLSLGTKKKAYS